MNGLSDGKIIVTNAFSGAMINFEKYSTTVTKITEEEFRENAPLCISHIGNKGIAKRYGLELNKSHIELAPGDELYVVYIHGGTLPESGRLPWNVNLSFEHIEVKA